MAFPRGKPESPDAAAARKKYSWVTPVSGKSARTSIESQPVRFRTVDSWVSLQALRAGTVGKAEVTPVECRANPGSAVAYSEEGRVEGRVLDGLGLSL